MLIQNVLGTQYDLHVCKWPSGSFETCYNWYWAYEEVNIRVFVYELELCLRPPPKSTVAEVI